MGGPCSLCQMGAQVDLSEIGNLQACNCTSGTTSRRVDTHTHVHAHIASLCMEDAWTAACAHLHHIAAQHAVPHTPQAAQARCQSGLPAAVKWWRHEMVTLGLLACPKAWAEDECKI